MTAPCEAVLTLTTGWIWSLMALCTVHARLHTEPMTDIGSQWVQTIAASGYCATRSFR